MDPEHQLVDETGREQIARQLTAAGHEQVAVEFVLQLPHALRELALDHGRVPVERPVQGREATYFGIGLIRSAQGPVSASQ
jgi:hypothetical protein